MASLLAPAPASSPGPGRISQLLPTVKCSNCNNPVALAELGEHKCEEPPPLPTSSQPLGQRLQNLVFSPKPNNIPLPRSPGPGRVNSPQQQSQHRPMPSTSSTRSREPSGPSLSPSPPHPDRSASASPRRELHTPSISSPLRDRAPSNASMDFRARTISVASSVSSPSTARPSLYSSHSRDSPSPTPSSRIPSPQPPPSPRPQPQSQKQLQGQLPPLPTPSYFGPPKVETPKVDTKTGGEAGMAGVGRRGFAAAAHAAVFIAPSHDTIQSRRENAPRLLDINAALQSTATPPLTANSGYSTSSPGPVSPASPIAKPASQAAMVAGTSPVSPIGVRLPFFDKFRNKLPGSPGEKPQPSPGAGYGRSRTSSSTSRGSDRSANNEAPVPPSPGSGSEFGLAYADSDDEDGDDQDIDRRSLKGKNPPPPLPLTGSDYRSKGQNSSEQGTGDRNGHNRSNSSAIAQALGLSQTPLSAYGKLGAPPTRSGKTLSSGSSSVGSRSAYSRTSSMSSGHGLNLIASSSSAVASGRLERAMETLLEDVDPNSGSHTLLSKSKSTGKQKYFERQEDKGLVVTQDASKSSLPSRSNTVGMPYSPDSKPVKLPTRARTERERSADASPKKSKRVKDCVRCERRIDDGRWIQVDSGGVLCERCWKNMYLPKCRRCDLPIEKQAVSSSDGQLKGKYHKDCFNCHICQKPFPDKTFYVFDGKPLCGYHYHEANRSLCAAPKCGQPIEGPCAVSHTGDRFHPEHLSCGYSGCGQTLEEYWELDGRMLCQRHAKWVEEDEYVDNKATRRVTRYIDLAGAPELGLR